MSFMQHIVCKGSGDEFQRSLKVEEYVFGEFGVLSFSGLPFVLCSMVCLPTALGITQTWISFQGKHLGRSWTVIRSASLNTNWQLACRWRAVPLYLWIASPKLRQANLSLLQLTTDWIFSVSCFEFVSYIYFQPELIKRGIKGFYVIFSQKKKKVNISLIGKLSAGCF